mgnify:CR=1 FL=1
MQRATPSAYAYAHRVLRTRIHSIPRTNYDRTMKKMIAAAALTLGATSCLGPNHMYNGLTNWNARLSDQDWVDELVFLGLNFIPVYGLALLGDVVVVNTIDYWSGENPISEPGPFPHDAFGR